MIVGKYTYMVEPIDILEVGENADIIIGSFCSIAKGLKVLLGGNHRTDWITTFPFGHIHQEIFNQFDGNGHPTTKGSIVIGNDVWIGRNCTIMSGVKIGDGAVIGANSVVAKDIPPYAIAVGNPAKVVKFRFNPDIIDKLLEIKWWEWEDEKINDNLHILCSNNFKLLK